MAPIVLGTWYSAGAVTPTNPLYAADEMAGQLRDSGTSMIVTHASVIDAVLAVPSQVKIPHRNILILGETEDPQKRIPHWRNPSSATASASLSPQVKICNPKTAVALLPYSSGTTGKPKGVVLTHCNMTSNMLQAANTHRAYFSWDGGHENAIDDVPAAERYNQHSGEGGDKILAVLPIFHVYGMILELLLPMPMGTLLVISPRFDLLNFCADIKQHAITKVYIIPPIVLGLWKNADLVDEKLGRGWGEEYQAVL